MVDRKVSNFFALNNVYVIVSHPPAIYLFTCAIAHIMLINYLTMRISPHIVLLFVTRLNITFFFIVRLTALFENVNMLLGGIYLRGLISFSAMPLVLIVSVCFECFFDGCILDAVRFSNVSKICIHGRYLLLCICGTSQPPCYTLQCLLFQVGVPFLVCQTAVGIQN